MPAHTNYLISVIKYMFKTEQVFFVEVENEGLGELWIHPYLHILKTKGRKETKSLQRLQ